MGIATANVRIPEGMTAKQAAAIIRQNAVELQRRLDEAAAEIPHPDPLMELLEEWARRIDADGTPSQVVSSDEIREAIAEYRLTRLTSTSPTPDQSANLS